MKIKSIFFVAAVVLSFGSNIFGQKADNQIESVLQTLKKYDDA